MKKGTHRKHRRASDGSTTLGQVNRNIDEVMHRFFRLGPVPIIIDSVAHAIVERDPPKSLEKFFLYNFSPLLRESLKLARKMRRR